jgi:nucleotide-binding universal stress UspA family protein
MSIRLPIAQNGVNTDQEEKMGGTILCGVDGSVDSQAALMTAQQYASRLDARLIVAHVIEDIPETYGAVGPMPTGSATGPMVLAPTKSQRDGARLLLDEVASSVGVEHAQQRVAFGYAAERLADLADEEGADLIVVGSHGKGAFRAGFLGSVSKTLVGVARCPILIVPPGVSHG